MSISTKPASGFRDFLPEEMRRRQHIFQIIREVYASHGFEEIDTPCFERLDTLMGKYGDEGDQLLFKVLQRGNKLDKALAMDEPKDTDLADMGLRYDLTVPLARIYAQYKRSPALLQALPDRPGVARRSSSEGALSRVLPV